MRQSPLPHPEIERFAAEALAETRVRVVYLFGSAAEGTDVPSSDIDLFVVLRGAVVNEEGADVTARLRSIAAGSEGPPLDLVVVAEDDLRRDGHFRIERGSRLVAGDDIRPELPPTSLDAFIRHYAGAPLAYMAVFRPGRSIVAPLDYPDPSGQFYGYDSRTLPPAGVPAHNVKGLVALVCWIVTMRLARERGVMVASKAESVVSYAAEIGDDWTSFIEAVYECGHDRWRYLVPDDPGERVLLRGLCEQTLGFENDYLARCAPYP